MLPKSPKNAEKSENGKFVKIDVSLKRNTDFRGSEASKIEQKSLKKQSQKQKRKKDKKIFTHIEWNMVLTQKLERKHYEERQ